MIGQRGVPATFGGVEHHVEELGARLAARGHDVTVYCRTNYVTERNDEYRGMRLRNVPTVGTKHLDAIVHSAISTALCLGTTPDVVHYHALGPGLLAPLPRFLSKAKVVQTVHGLDYERAKWGGGARAVLKTAGWMSARVPDATITVSRTLADHYDRRYRHPAVYIPNGVNPPNLRPADEIVSRFGLRPGSYLLYVGRLVPEKAPDILLRAFRSVPGDVRLVLAGGSNFTDGYVRELERLCAADPRVVVAGFVYGKVLEELYSNALAFVLPSFLEGLPLVLLEAASYGIPVIASDIPSIAEIVGPSGPGRRLFEPGDETALASSIRGVMAGRQEERSGAAELACQILGSYSWEPVASSTEALYLRLVGAGRGVLGDERITVRPGPAGSNPL